MALYTHKHKGTVRFAK